VQTSAVIEPGAVLAGKYRLESKIGSGAFGAVFKATHLALANQVAVKVLQSNMVPTQEALARFQREGVSACRIQHPNAVSIIDFGVTDNGVAYLSMELLSGHSLAEEIQKRSPFSPRRCAEILVPLCDVLGEAHAAGIIHRDIKPANVFLHHGRSGEVVKVLDFGIAKLLDDGGAELTVEGSLVGTPAYMAPERLSSAPYDGRSDVYSVGIMLYEMLCGQPPFKSKDLMAVAMMQMTQEPRPPREHNSSIPRAVEALVLETLSKDPAQRPTPAALAERFSNAANEAASAAADDTLNFKTPETVKPARMPVPTAPAAAPSAARPTPKTGPPKPAPIPEPEPEEGSIFGRLRRKLFGG
jgi:serine/threonine protein kinase